MTISISDSLAETPHSVLLRLTENGNGNPVSIVPNATLIGMLEEGPLREILSRPYEDTNAARAAIDSYVDLIFTGGGTNPMAASFVVQGTDVPASLSLTSQNPASPGSGTLRISYRHSVVR